MKRTFLLLSILTCTLHGLLAADPGKAMHAIRVSTSIQLDGKLDEAIWSQVAPAGDFVEFEPDPGGQPEYATDVRILYDDEALYVGAVMHVDDPESILREMSLRDEFGNTDWFGVIMSPYKDGINGVGFYLMAAGVQADCKYSVFGEDFSWNSVWSSAVHIGDQFWSVEYKIPYSAIRFPEKPIQEWHVNFGRMVRETREKSFWSPLDPEKEGFLDKSGLLQGIRDIKPPIRLSATPFLVTSVENHFDPTADQKTSWDQNISGGIDIKYGISNAFTLDMTLIPDFSQAKSDNEVLNLSPFEVHFDENRQFFTEGTELFNKGGLFYSRRVGGRPLRVGEVEDELKPGQTILENPSRTRLLNALKVSGRTDSGLGLGLFNGITENTYARVRDENGNVSKILTDPVTNYNVIALDQTMRNNSSLSLVNASTLRSGSFYDANATGVGFEINTRENKYGLSGGGVLSQKYFIGDTDLGHRWNLRFARQSGTMVWGVSYWEEGDTYDINDLGFVGRNNESNYSAWVEWRRFKPFGKFKRAFVNLSSSYERLHRPSEFRQFDIELSGFLLTQDNVGLRLWSEIIPVEGRDFHEPRTDDFSRYLEDPAYANIGWLVSTNYNKRFALFISMEYGSSWTDKGRYYMEFQFEPRFRINDRFSIFTEFDYEFHRKDEGFVDADESSIGYNLLQQNDILFGRRDRKTFETSLDVKYIFSSDMGLTIRARHYWDRVEYEEFGRLNEGGGLDLIEYRGENESGETLHDENFNAFNIDLIYSWRFAPGSDLIFVWKNQVIGSGLDPRLSYWENADFFKDAPRINNFSLKAVYYLDYLYLKKG